MLSIMYKSGATIDVLFPCVGFLFVNMAYILLFYSNDYRRSTISFHSNLLPRALNVNDPVMRERGGFRGQCLGFRGSEGV